MGPDESLVKLGNSTAEAVAGVLETFVPGHVESGSASVIARGNSPFSGIVVPAVATSVSYVDGVTGGNLFIMSRVGVHRLAAAMMGQDPYAIDPSPDDELGEMELSAASEAMNQMMAAGAVATGAVIGQEVEISVPEIAFLESIEQADEAFALESHTTIVAFSVCGEPCRLVQLVPNAFVVKMTHALEELSMEAAVSSIGGGETLRPEALYQIPVRLAVELGRVRMSLARAVGLPAGAVVELDRAADDPVDLMVNGRRVGIGRLLLVDGNEWAVRIETVFEEAVPLALTSEGGR